MNGFLGEYDVTLDPKGRFLLPASLKKQTGMGESSFVINRGFEKCLGLYPLKSWEPIFEKLSKLNDFDPKVRAFRRYFLNGATMVELDSAGRLLIPGTLKDYAGLEKDIVIAPGIKKLEIWDKSKYQEIFETFTPEAFSSLAEEVMREIPEN